VSQSIELSRHALGGLEDRLDGGGLEEGQLAAGETQAMGEVVGQFLTVKAAEVMAHDDALGEGFMHRHGDLAGDKTDAANG
jgi:hypothetical protein